MSDSGRYSERGSTEYRDQVEILDTILNHYTALRQRAGQRWIDDDLCRRLILNRFNGHCSAYLPSCLSGGRFGGNIRAEKGNLQERPSA